MTDVRKAIPNWKPDTIETKRLLLRPLSLDDVSDIYEYCKNPDATVYTGFPKPKSPKDTLEFIESTINRRYAEKNEPEWAICLKDEKDQKVLGTLGCFFGGFSHRKIIELGYMLGQEHWGKGYATEASEAARDFCFRNYDINRFQARCVAENFGSWKVMEKIGMQCDGTLRDYFKKGDDFWDFKVYSILRREWEAQFQEK